jgi:hypothetical protein
MQAESCTFYKWLSWKDPLGSLVDHDVANRSYRINIYDIMTPTKYRTFNRKMIMDSEEWIRSDWIGSELGITTYFFCIDQTGEGGTNKKILWG